MPRAAWWVALVGVLAAGPAGAATLTVGGTHPTFAAAVAAAAAGDTVRLPPGEFYECVVIRQRELVIEGAGAGTVLTDSVCAGKAILVADGARLVVRDLVLARARSPDRNGAGIRLEGGDLVLERVRFSDNQAGVLSGQAGTVRVTDCAFAGSGEQGALHVDRAQMLRVESSDFEPGAGDQITTGATRTELVGNQIAAGPGWAVRGFGGSLLMQENRLSAGPARLPRDAAVLVDGGTAELVGNRLDNRTGSPVTLLLDWTRSDPVLRGNVVGTGDSEAGSGGVWRHRIGGAAREAYGGVRHLLGSALRAVWH